MSEPIVMFCKQKTGMAAVKLLLAKGADIRAVFVMQSMAEAEWYRNICTVCEDAHIEFVPVRLLSTQKEIWDKIRQTGAKFGFSVLYTQIFPQHVINVLSKGLVNFHPSLLPTYRGPHPVNWAIINGETRTGVTAHFVAPGVDTGPIITQTALPIYQNDTIHTLMDGIEQEILQQVEHVYDLLHNRGLTGIPQDETNASYYPKRSPEDGKIDWATMTARQIYNMSRALLPPLYGAFFQFQGRHVILRQCEPLDEALPLETLNPGTVEFKTSEHLVVVTSDGRLKITHLEDESGADVSFSNFIPGSSFT